MNYGQRQHDGLPISTAFVESAVNETLSKRMIKKQQMRWNRWTVQPFLDVRIAVLNKTLGGLFRRLYPSFQADFGGASAQMLHPACANANTRKCGAPAHPVHRTQPFGIRLSIKRGADAPQLTTFGQKASTSHVKCPLLNKITLFAAQRDIADIAP